MYWLTEKYWFIESWIIQILIIFPMQYKNNSYLFTLLLILGKKVVSGRCQLCLWWQDQDLQTKIFSLKLKIYCWSRMLLVVFCYKLTPFHFRKVSDRYRIWYKQYLYISPSREKMFNEIFISLVYSTNNFPFKKFQCNKQL